MKFMKISAFCLGTLLCTACNVETSVSDTNVDVGASDVSETVAETTTCETSATENGSESGSAVPESTTTTVDAHSVGLQKQADAYASLLYSILMQDGGCSFVSPCAPDYMVSFAPTTFDDTFAPDSDIAFCDVNIDGEPEILVGSHGVNGTGALAVYTEDGDCLGAFASDVLLEGLCVIDDVMYERCGTNWTETYTRLDGNMPSVSMSRNADATAFEVIIRDASGSENALGAINSDEITGIVTTYLGVDYGVLCSADYAEIPLVMDTLRVPDPENYTEQDIYNCIANLLEQYEALLVD